jgi:hypothetical protein
VLPGGPSLRTLACLGALVLGNIALCPLFGVRSAGSSRRTWAIWIDRILKLGIREWGTEWAKSREAVN